LGTPEGGLALAGTSRGILALAEWDLGGLASLTHAFGVLRPSLALGGSAPALCTTGFVERYAAKNNQHREDLQILAMKAREMLRGDDENSRDFAENIGFVELGSRWVRTQL